jgi:hypothetical protein
VGLTAVDTDAIRAAFDAQVRQRTEPDEPGAVLEAGRGVWCWRAAAPQTSRIEWSALTARTADAAIAAQVRYFRARGTPVEWKLFDYDQPPDLGQRLRSAGFEPGEEEVMLVAETAEIATPVTLPEGVRIVTVRDEAGLAAMLSVHEQAFGRAADGQAASLATGLAHRLRTTPGQLEILVAMAGTEPVASARVEFMPGTDFAGLWGGGTVPGWRGRGLFRALVACRAGMAAARGVRYLQVDAAPMSRPILLRLGFTPVAATTPYLFTPPGARP